MSSSARSRVFGRPFPIPSIVKGVPSLATVAHIRQGIELDDGLTAPANATLVSGTEERSREGGRSIVELRISEGKKRQVRGMMGAVGHPVTRLVRVGFGPVQLGDLAVGLSDRWRTLRSRR